MFIQAYGNIYKINNGRFDKMARHFNRFSQETFESIYDLDRWMGPAVTIDNELK